MLGCRQQVCLSESLSLASHMQGLRLAGNLDVQQLVICRADRFAAAGPTSACRGDFWSRTQGVAAQSRYASVPSPTISCATVCCRASLPPACPLSLTYTALHVQVFVRAPAAGDPDDAHRRPQGALQGAAGRRLAVGGHLELPGTTAPASQSP